LQGVNTGEIHFQLTRRVLEKQLPVTAGDVLKMNGGTISGNTKLQRNAGKVCNGDDTLNPCFVAPQG
jgi:hypothetical protein